MSTSALHEPRAGATEPAELAEHPIVFFDGMCGLCDWSVDFVLARDRRQVFRFAPLQGETAAAQLDAGDVRRLTSVVLLDETGVWRHSSAVVRILRRLGGRWRLLGNLLWLVPKPLRDVGYRLVASNRYRIFGKKDACRLPTPEERERFLM